MFSNSSASQNLTFDLHIPSFLVEDKSLSITEKFFIGIIEALTSKKGYCYATNKFLASKLNVEQTYVSKLISKLTKLGYLVVEYAKNNEFFERSGRRVFLSSEAKKMYPKPIKQNTNPPCTTVQSSRTKITNKKSSIEILKETNKQGREKEPNRSRFKAMSKAKNLGLEHELKNCSEDNIKDIALKINELTPGAKQKIEDQVAISRPIVDEIAEVIPVNKIPECIESLFKRKEGYALKELKRKKISYLLKDFKDEILGIYQSINRFDSMFDDSKWATC